MPMLPSGITSLLCQYLAYAHEGPCNNYMTLRYYGSYIYYSAWVDYVSGSVSGIAFLNFESTVVVCCFWFWLKKDEFEHA